MCEKSSDHKHEKLTKCLTSLGNTSFFSYGICNLNIHGKEVIHHVIQKYFDHELFILKTLPSFKIDSNDFSSVS